MKYWNNRCAYFCAQTTSTSLSWSIETLENVYKILFNELWRKSFCLNWLIKLSLIDCLINDNYNWVSRNLVLLWFGVSVCACSIWNALDAVDCVVAVWKQNYLKAKFSSVLVAAMCVHVCMLSIITISRVCPGRYRVSFMYSTLLAIMVTTQTKYILNSRSHFKLTYKKTFLHF